MNVSFLHYVCVEMPEILKIKLKKIYKKKHWVFWPSDWVVDYIHIDFLDPRLLGQNTRYTELCVQYEKLE